MMEAAVVSSLKRHLISHGIQGQSISSVLVDSDGSYTQSPHRNALEPMASLRVSDFRLDLICSSHNAGASQVLGFEVKPDFKDWREGVAQAATYQRAVHQSYLAIPRDKAKSASELERQAGQLGVGLMLKDNVGWHESVEPVEPLPLPAGLDITQRLLDGVPFVRRLQLNHPLNYLVIAHLRASYPDQPLDLLLQAHWPDLGSPGTRLHAIGGAQSLGLIDTSGQLTVDGTIAADLLNEMEFDPATRPTKRNRLADEAPQLAVVARVCLLRQPAVRFVIETLQRAAQGGLDVKSLISKARNRERLLSDALFLANPELDDLSQLNAQDYNPSTVFKFKQVLWHAGILATKAHSSAGGKRDAYSPEHDIWQLDPRITRTLHQAELS